ncbi:MAG: hypothetical protein SCH70_14830, partial [Candidatus Methanoperedens sp.]|nr:hypothetical protein [Candidatus Methanoperedens sp.]
MPDNAKYFDWYTYQEDIDFSCPYCGGSERIKSELWLKDILQDKSGKTQLNTLYKKYLNECIADNTEPEDFHTWLEEAYENEELNDIGDSACQKCENGYIYPMYNYAYPVRADVTDENRRIAYDCGLFLFEDPEDGDAYMSLMGCGMDLSPNILLAYLKLTDDIPYDWALEFRQDYRANLSESDHIKIAIACRETINYEFQTVERKLKALDLFIDNPELLKQRLKEREASFNRALECASGIDDPIIRGLAGMMAFSKASGDVTERYTMKKDEIIDDCRTTGLFWDCECKEDFIQPRNVNT